MRRVLLSLLAAGLMHTTACTFDGGGVGAADSDGSTVVVDGGPDGSTLPDARPGSQRLTVAVTGSGTVTSSPPGIACGSGDDDCVFDFDDGDEVTLTATGTPFSWSQDCSGDEATCELTMDASRAATATFAQLGDVKRAMAFGSTGADVINAVVIAADGDLIIGGSYGNDLDLGGEEPHAGGLDGFVARVTPLGVPKWVVTFGDTAEDGVYGLALDGDGDVVLAGVCAGDEVKVGSCPMFNGFSANDQDIVVARLDGDTGGCIWAERFGGTADDAARAVAVSGATVLVGGFFASTINFDSESLVAIGATDGFVLAMARATGSVTNVTRVGGSGSDEVRALAVSGANVLAGGLFNSLADFGGGNHLAAGFDGFVVTLAIATLGYVDERIIGGTGDDTVDALAAAGNAVAIGGRYSGTVAIGGTTLPTGASANAFVAVFVGDDATIVKGVATSGLDVVRAVALPGDGTVIAAGELGNDVDLGAGPQENEGGQDAFVLRAGPGGAHVWSIAMGSNGADVIRALGLGATSVWAVGALGDDATIGGMTLMHEGGTTDTLLVELTLDP